MTPVGVTGAPLRAPGGPVVMVSRCGAIVDLPVDRWRAQADAAERELLARLADPVLDVGCGPGRIVGALAAAGRPALGVDPSGAAVGEARRRGVPVLRRSVFGPLPGEGRWGSVLLLDGNIGIGGHPEALLARVARLLRPGGVVVAEVGPPGRSTERLTVRIETPGAVGPWFPWAVVGADAIGDLTRRVGLRTARVEHVTPPARAAGSWPDADVADAGGRWFAWAMAA